MDDHPKRQFAMHHTVGCLGAILVTLIAASAGGSVKALIYLPGGQGEGADLRSSMFRFAV